jgi:excisionase family DNA binding protein
MGTRFSNGVLPLWSGPDALSDQHAVLTVMEVARELRCSKAHVHNLINGKVPSARPLPALRLGRRRLILRTSLDSWVHANEAHDG